MMSYAVYACHTIADTDTLNAPQYNTTGRHEGVKMFITGGDMFALVIALFASTVTLTLAFRRVYVLEKTVARLRRQLRK